MSFYRWLFDIVRSCFSLLIKCNFNKYKSRIVFTELDGIHLIYSCFILRKNANLIVFLRDIDIFNLFPSVGSSTRIGGVCSNRRKYGQRETFMCENRVRRYWVTSNVERTSSRVVRVGGGLRPLFTSSKQILFFEKIVQSIRRQRTGGEHIAFLRV